MSDHNERACFHCGSFLHSDDQCLGDAVDTNATADVLRKMEPCPKCHSHPGATIGLCEQITRLTKERDAALAEAAALQKALRDIAGLWSDDSDHSRSHDPETCEVVICVAKRALRRLNA